jgi:DNA replication and repair protein RecF
VPGFAGDPSWLCSDAADVLPFDIAVAGFSHWSVHLAELRLRDFRNYRRLDVTFWPGCHVLLGANAQGKTNILESIYLLATLRSFRGVGGAQMIRHGAKGYFVGGRLVGQSMHSVKAYWAPTERRLSLDDRPVKRLADYYGVLRAVVFCSEDLQLVKGPARGRRRFLDLLLAQTSPGYLPLLLRYTQALKSRNALLKNPAADRDALEGFTRQVVEIGEQLMQARRELLPRISPVAQMAYRRIAGDSEELVLEYAPSVKADFAVTLANSRARERTFRTTLHGPHRDDLSLRVNGEAAGSYTSEGQKRTLALALKLAQAEYLAGIHGVPPVLLIDDVMGELDARRRAAFVPLLNQVFRAGGQVFMTCTEESWPRDLGRELIHWEVRSGSIRRRE